MCVIRTTRVKRRDRSQNRIRIRCHVGVLNICQNRTRIASSILSVIVSRRHHLRRYARTRMCVITRVHITCIPRGRTCPRSIDRNRRGNRDRINIITRTRMINRTLITVRMRVRVNLIHCIRTMRCMRANINRDIIISSWLYELYQCSNSFRSIQCYPHRP